MKIFGWELFGSKQAETETVSIDALAPWKDQYFDGGKFPGGFGDTHIQTVDYWTLRARSAQLFNENLYARGIIRRMVTNEINTGLSPEAIPDEEIIGVPEDSLLDWSETRENRFALWANTPELCDWKGEKTFGALQREVRLEALVEGDILVVLRTSPVTGLPRIQLVSGSSVRTPPGNEAKLREGSTITHGVERNKIGRVVGYWIQQEDSKYRRLSAYGPGAQMRIAWLEFGTDKRMDEVRGQPLISIIMYSLKEIDRFRDSAQRKASVNSHLAMFVKKTQDKMGSLPITNSAVRRDQVSGTDSDGAARKYDMASQLPGLIIEELQHGEEPVGFAPKGVDQEFNSFEDAIISGISWALEIPPEVLKLSFSNNYSASQAAINEYKMTINLRWGDFGETFCSRIYVDHLIGETLSGKNISPGLLEAWRDPQQYDVLAAWTATEWYGSIKPSTDMLKQAKGSKILTDEGWSTNAREARVTTGTKFSKNMKRLARENELKVKAATPIAEFKLKYGVAINDDEIQQLSADDEEIQVMLEDYLDARN